MVNCKKIVYDDLDWGNPKVLYGIIENEDATHINFKTAKKHYLIARKCILSISDTPRRFESREGFP